MPFGHDIVAEAGCIGIFAILINTLYLKKMCLAHVTYLRRLSSSLWSFSVCHLRLVDFDTVKKIHHRHAIYPSIYRKQHAKVLRVCKIDVLSIVSVLKHGPTTACARGLACKHITTPREKRWPVQWWKSQWSRSWQQHENICMPGGCVYQSM
jgi:hypothetical protein